jgi:hypothetical protein
LIARYSLIAFLSTKICKHATNRGAAAKSCDALLKRVEENDVNLTDLVILPSKSFGGPEVERLAAALSENTHLKSLSASGHAVPPTALRVLAQAMVQSTTFTKIAVGDKDMGDEGVIALCSSGCGNMEVLDLAYKSVSEKGMKVLGETFGNSTRLMELNLSRNPTIGNQGLVAFCEAVSGDVLLPNLHTLNIAECEIGAEGVGCLSTLLVQTGCTTLGLASNPLGASSCSSLIPLLKQSAPRHALAWKRWIYRKTELEQTVQLSWQNRFGSRTNLAGKHYQN